jgi:hypothetical protein
MKFTKKQINTLVKINNFIGSQSGPHQQWNFLYRFHPSKDSGEILPIHFTNPIYTKEDIPYLNRLYRAYKSNCQTREEWDKMFIDCPIPDWL